MMNKLATCERTEPPVKTGTFYGAKVDWQNELSYALELMGKETTDLNELIRSVSMLYLHCPEEWAERYGRVLDMVIHRHFFTIRHRR